MRKREMRKCSQCGETKFFYSPDTVCAACKWWEKHHSERRSTPIRIRDGLKTEHQKEYNSLRSAKGRCTNPNNKKYKDYGGRGIKICERWLGPYGFHNFYNDMGDCPDGCSLDRIDVNGDYSPDNCRWANASIQGSNKRDKRIYSEHVGVSYNKTLKLWYACLQKNKKTYIRYAKTEKEAIKKRKELEELILGINIDS